MDGLSFVLFVEKELKKRKIPKGTFYEATGVSSATMSQWRNNIHDPSPENIRRIEKYLGINFRLEPENAGDKAPDQNKKPAATNDSELKDPEAFMRLQQVNDMYLSFDEAKKAQVLAYMKFLASQQ